MEPSGKAQSAPGAAVFIPILEKTTLPELILRKVGAAVCGLIQWHPVDREGNVPQASEGIWQRRSSIILVGIAAGGLVIGLVLSWQGPRYAPLVWSAATLTILISLSIQVFGALRRGDVGLDIVAALSMSAAIVFGEPLAGNVVGLMYAGGQLLEAFAEGRARREMTALMGRISHFAMRHGTCGLEEIAISRIQPGDRLLIRQGEVLPVDGIASGEGAALDMAALTGEPLPQPTPSGAEALSGSTCVGAPFDLVASRTAAESTYAGIIRLVEAAQASKAPMVRMADRFAVGFLVLTLIIAGGAWYFSEDPIRALAVLVVATPCPLILAVPVAIISGMSKAAGIGVLVKNGGMLEMLGRVQTAVLDKTGTLTHGQAAVIDIRTVSPFTAEAVLGAAASLDQASGHVVAAALIRAATESGLSLSKPEGVREVPGTGIEGYVEGRRIVVGGSGFVQRMSGCEDPHDLITPEMRASMTVAVAIDGALAGMIVLKDQVRADAMSVLADLRTSGIRRLVLASGDRAEIAHVVGQALGMDAVLGDLTPEAKVDAVRRETGNGPVMMVGDGVNDAPALAAADIGVAMGARGTASSSEAAGVVVLVDELAPLAKAIAIARRSRRIALQSVSVGLTLSVGAMVAAAFGYLQPVEGAILQEAIDVAVILNALRALR
ncbi:heavy metal translocating P-type ATPase [Shinella zoogloeoides]|uniref:heavy metal translocating P-type ATPase n=1 Tax=Shinella zoogloeoides TaxID=352475 RepID=UPI001F57344D|nr:heavy metal translocating P-type ATPase [Shinella zoogloeoides]